MLGNTHGKVSLGCSVLYLLYRYILNGRVKIMYQTFLFLVVHMCIDITRLAIFYKLNLHVLTAWFSVVDCLALNKLYHD